MTTSKSLHFTKDTHFPLQQTSFIQHLQVLGLSLIAVSILYLVAANWFMLPQFVQLAIPPFILLLSASFSVFIEQNHRLRQTLDTISGLMVGLSLAVIGQTYQTGADSYQLFLVWALLLLPWLYRPNIGIFTLFCIVSHLALVLFFQQSFWIITHYSLLLILINFWTACLLLLSLKFYPALRWVFLVWIGIFSIGCMVSFTFYEQADTLISSIFLPSLCIIYFYLKKEPLTTSLATLILGINLTILLMKSILIHLVPSSITGTLLICAIIILAWFAALAFALKQLFPHSQFNVIPLAVGAWLAGILLASTLLIAWEEASLVFALIAMIVALIYLKKSDQLFARQFFYCLLFCGQTAFLGHIMLFVENPLAVFILQFILVIVFFSFRLHWFVLFLQLTTLYILGIFSITESLSWYQLSSPYSLLYWQLLNFAFYSLMFALSYLNQTYIRSILMALLGILTIVLGFYPHFSLINTEINPLHNIIFYINFILPLLWSLLFFVLMVRPYATVAIQLGYISFALVLIICQFFEILPLFMILAWSLKEKEKLLYGLNIISIILSLWLLYYSLDLSFLIKAFMIFISGLAVFLFAILLLKKSMPLAQNKIGEMQ